MAPNTVINEKLGAWVLENGNTREILADKLGITRPTLRSRLDGETSWRFEEVIEIAKLTGTSIDELAGLRAAS